MPIVSCPGCGGRTPSSAARCVHCGKLPPECPDCAGSGRRPADGGVVSPESFGSWADVKNTGGDGVCPGCAGQKRKWPGGG